MTIGTTGTRSFAVNAGHTIWQLKGGVAPSEPFGTPATPIQERVLEVPVPRPTISGAA